MVYSECRSSDGVIRQIVLPISLVIQLYAIAHITYYKWKYHCEDNKVHILQQHPAVFTVGSEIEKITAGRRTTRPLQGKVDEENQMQKNHIPRFNTKAHNPLLFEMTHIVCYVIAIGVSLVMHNIITGLAKDDYYTVSPVIFYVQYLFPGFVIQVVSPLFF